MLTKQFIILGSHTKKISQYLSSELDILNKKRPSICFTYFVTSFLNLNSEFMHLEFASKDLLIFSDFLYLCFCGFFSSDFVMYLASLKKDIPLSSIQSSNTFCVV